MARIVGPVSWGVLHLELKRWNFWKWLPSISIKFRKSCHQSSVCTTLKVSGAKPLASHDWLQSESRQKRKLLVSHEESPSSSSLTPPLSPSSSSYSPAFPSPAVQQKPAGPPAPPHHLLRAPHLSMSLSKLALLATDTKVEDCRLHIVTCAISWPRSKEFGNDSK